MGFCMSTALAPQIVNLHFDKRMSIANGIVFGGDCLGGFVLPFLVEKLIHSYGLSGTFLIMGALLLHSFPLALLLWTPNSKSNKNVVSSTELPNNTTDAHESALMFENQDIQNLDKPAKKEHIASPSLGQLDMSCEMKSHSSHEVSDPCNQSFRKLIFQKLDNPTNKEHLASPSLGQLDVSCEMKSHSSHEVSDPCNQSFSKLVFQKLDNPTNKEHLASPSLGQLDRNCEMKSNSSHEVSDPCNQSFSKLVLQKLDNSTNKEHLASPSLGQLDMSCEMKSHSSHEVSDPCNQSFSKLVFQKLDNPTNKEHPASPTLKQLDMSCEAKSRSSFEMSGPCNQSFSKLVITDSVDDIDNINHRDSPKILNNETYIKAKPKDMEIGANHTKHSIFRVFIDPTFMLIALTQSTFVYVNTFLTTIIIDLGRDFGVKDYQEPYLLMSFAVCDLMGRFCLGVIADGRYLTVVNFSLTCFSVMSVFFLASIFIRGFAFLIILMSVFGLLKGGLIAVFPAMCVEFVEKDKITMALTSTYILHAPMTLTQSPLIGLFREQHGSYVGILILLCVLNSLCSAMSYLTPISARRRDRNNRSTP